MAVFDVGSSLSHHTNDREDRVLLWDCNNIQVGGANSIVSIDL